MISSENKRYHKIALLVSNKLCGFREVSEMIARYTIESENEMNRLYHSDIYNYCMASSRKWMALTPLSQKNRQLMKRSSRNNSGPCLHTIICRHKLNGNIRKMYPKEYHTLPVSVHISVHLSMKDSDVMENGMTRDGFPVIRNGRLAVSREIGDRAKVVGLRSDRLLWRGNHC